MFKIHRNSFSLLMFAWKQNLIICCDYFSLFFFLVLFNKTSHGGCYCLFVPKYIIKVILKEFSFFTKSKGSVPLKLLKKYSQTLSQSLPRESQILAFSHGWPLFWGRLVHVSHCRFPKHWLTFILRWSLAQVWL